MGDVTLFDLFLVFQLVLMEALLSFDNSLALSSMVTKRLKDPKDQKRALTYGIWGAYFFRTVIVFIGVWLIKFAWVKVLAGSYLVYLAISELFFNHSGENDGTEIKIKSKDSYFLSPLWSTILAVELMDLAFSVDSIGVALALSNKLWVLLTGAVFGIAMMRFAAILFIKLIKHFPILEKTAFVLVGIAGGNILLGIQNLPIFSYKFSLNYNMGEHTLPVVLFAIFLGSMGYDYLRQKFSNE
jgi:YkoY family integral membrane protein